MRETGRLAWMVVIAAFLLGFAPEAAKAQCTSPTASVGSLEWFSGDSRFKACIGTSWVEVAADSALTACTTAGQLDYDSTENAPKFCDGSNWQKVACVGGGGCTKLTTCSTAGQINYSSGDSSFAWCDGTGLDCFCGMIKMI